MPRSTTTTRQPLTLVVLALALALTLLHTPRCNADRDPTVRTWREFQYGRVRPDGVEYFEFDVPEDAFRVFVTFNRGELDKVPGPTMLIKYGGLPTSGDYEQLLELNVTDDYYTLKVDNLRSGRYYMTLLGGTLFESLTAFVGSYSKLFYYLDVYYFGCSDPTRTGNRCNIPKLPGAPIVTPTTSNVAPYFPDHGGNEGCIDNAEDAIYYTFDVASSEWDLTLSLTTSADSELRVVAGARLLDLNDVKSGDYAQVATIPAGSGERSVDLRITTPQIGSWTVKVSGRPPRESSCVASTGVAFKLTASHARDCSLLANAVLPGVNGGPVVDLCGLTISRMSELRDDPFKGDADLDALFSADQPVVGGDEGPTGPPERTRPVVGYLATLPAMYAGANLELRALVTANVPSFQVYARVGGYATPALFDYHFNSSGAVAVDRADNTSTDWQVAVQSYKWAPIVFPRVGPWHVLVVADSGLLGLPEHAGGSRNQSFWAVDVSMRTFACAPSACSGHGQCEMSRTYRGLVYGECSCHYGFGGEHCDTPTVEAKFRSHQILLLIASNAAILPVTFLSCRRKLYLDAVLFFATGLISAIYHTCDVEVACLLPYKFLQQMDFALSFNMIMLLSVHLSGARKQAKAGIQTVLFLLTIVMATNNATSMANWVAIGAVCVLQFSVTLVYYFVMGAQRIGKGKMIAFKSFLFRSDNFDRRYGILGGVLWFSALGCWFTSSPTNYWIIHSVWHMGAMLAAFCFIGLRRNDRYRMVDPSTGVDVLGVNYGNAKPNKPSSSNSVTINSEVSEKEVSVVIEEA